MSFTPFESTLFSGIFRDPELARILSDRSAVEKMVRFERALALAEGAAGVIPAEAAAGIDSALLDYLPDPKALAEGTERAGVPVPALVEALRARVGGTAAGFLHWGATSQDVMDTALVLQLGEALRIFEARLDRVISALCALAEGHRQTFMVGRTRGQQAAPTCFGLKAANWLLPLVRHRRRLSELRPRVLVLSFGGAVGNLSVLGEQAASVADTLARTLNLRAPPIPWHAQRDGLIECAFWCALVTGSLGKIAQDVLLMSQSEIGELKEGGQGRGGSSTMPQKANPVRSETILALTRHTVGLSGQMAQTAVHAMERDGAAWQGEWLAFGQILGGCGAALIQAEALVWDLPVDRGRMAENLANAKGLPFAEAASFALSAHMPRAEAQALVKKACIEVGQSGRDLMEVLAEMSEIKLDWEALRDPETHLGTSGAFIDRALGEARRL